MNDAQKLKLLLDVVRALTPLAGCSLTVGSSGSPKPDFWAELAGDLRTRGWSAEWHDEGVRVEGLALGFVDGQISVSDAPSLQDPFPPPPPPK